MCARLYIASTRHPPLPLPTAFDTHGSLCKIQSLQQIVPHTLTLWHYTQHYTLWHHTQYTQRPSAHSRSRTPLTVVEAAQVSADHHILQVCCPVSWLQPSKGQHVCRLPLIQHAAALARHNPAHRQTAECQCYALGEKTACNRHTNAYNANCTAPEALAAYALLILEAG